MFNHGLLPFSGAAFVFLALGTSSNLEVLRYRNIALAPVDYNVIPRTVFYDGYITSHQRSTFLPSFKQ